MGWWKKRQNRKLDILISKLHVRQEELRLQKRKENAKIAEGLAATFVPGPMSAEEKAEHRLEQLVGNRDNPDKIVEHFERLSREVDPLKDTAEIPKDAVRSIKSVNIREHDLRRS